MTIPTVHNPKTVGELKEILSMFPDDMPLYLASAGRSYTGYAYAVRLWEGTVGKSAERSKKVVYRGGIKSLFIGD